MLCGMNGGLCLGAKCTCGQLGKHPKVIKRLPEMIKEIRGAAVLHKRTTTEECEHFLGLLRIVQRSLNLLVWI